MKIVALLSFFDELPSFLAATVASCGRLCDHLIACDGAYSLFPDARGSSGSAQHEAITAGAEAGGLGLTLWVPTEKWEGDEVAKRSFMFELGRLVARDQADWFLVIDADEVIVDVPADARERLAATGHAMAQYGLIQQFDLGTAKADHDSLRWIPSRQTARVRGLYRNLPGLRVEGQHFRYAADIDGRTTDLWEHADYLDLHDLRLIHRRDRRPDDRNQRAREYYRIRDAVGAESAPDHLRVAV